MADDVNLYDYFGTGDIIGILLATVASFFIGFLWYGPLFGKKWAAEMGFDMPEKPSMKDMAPSMLKDIVGSLVLGYVLLFTMLAFLPSIWGDHLGVAAEDAGAWTYGVWGAGFVWLGFFVTHALSRTGWEGRSWSWFGIESGYQFVRLMVMAQILMALH